MTSIIGIVSSIAIVLFGKLYCRNLQKKEKLVFHG